MNQDIASLANRAMLASVTISAWQGRRLDKRVSDDVNREHAAAHDIARVTKSIVPRESLARVTRAAKRARDMHRTLTLPWHYDGVGLLTNSAYLKYTERMRECRVEFESAVAEFVAAYPALLADAPERMNGLYNAADYPSEQALPGLFTFRTIISNVPDAGDFRVDVGAEHAAAIRADIERDTRDAIARAMQNVYNRIADKVGRMADRLKHYKPPGGKGDKAESTFRDSLVENVQELVELIPLLNVSNDSKLAAIAERMARELCTESPDELRGNASARASVAQSAESILADVESLLA